MRMNDQTQRIPGSYKQQKLRASTLNRVPLILSSDPEQLSMMYKQGEKNMAKRNDNGPNTTTQASMMAVTSNNLRAGRLSPVINRNSQLGQRQTNQLIESKLMSRDLRNKSIPLEDQTATVSFASVNQSQDNGQLRNQ